jgi:hypothetical protein
MLYPAEALVLSCTMQEKVSPTRARLNEKKIGAMNE